MKTAIALFGGLTLLTLPALAAAQGLYDSGADNNSYFSVEVGSSQLHDHSYNVTGVGHITTTSSSGLMAGFGGGIDYTRWPLGTIRVELMLEHRNNDVSKDYLSDGSTLSGASGHLDNWSLMYNVINDFRPHTGFDPYLGVGIGYAWLDFSHYSANVGGTRITFMDDRSGEFAYQGLLGFRSTLTDRLDLDVGLHFLWTTNPSVSVNGGGTTDLIYATDALTVGLAYRF